MGIVKRLRVIQFGERSHVLEKAIRDRFGGSFQVTKPRFPDTCVCCNAATSGRIQLFHVTEYKQSSDPLPVPVCAACKDHALKNKMPQIILGVCLLIAAGFAAFGRSQLQDRPDEPVLYAFFVLAALAFGFGAAYYAWHRRGIGAIERAGHHPEMDVSFSSGATRLFTSNDVLANELLRINGDAAEPSRS